MQAIVLIGKTGAGKTVAGSGLAEHYGIPHISSGDLARDLAKGDKDTANALKAGLLAPEDAMRKLVQQKIDTATERYNGYVLDGFPRSVAQLIALLMWSPQEPLFFLLDLPDLDAITRLVSRQRDDDTPDALARRLAGFHAETQPMIDMLDNGHSLFPINVARPKDKVIATLISFIDRDRDRGRTG